MPRTLTVDDLALTAIDRHLLAEVHQVLAARPERFQSGPVHDIEVTKAWVAGREARYREHGLIWYLLTSNGQVVGTCGVTPGRTGPGEPELGYEVRGPWQQTGVATRAARAVAAAADSSGLTALWATIRPWNTASLRVANRVGFVEQYSRDDDKGELKYLRRTPAARGENDVLHTVRQEHVPV